MDTFSNTAPAKLRVINLFGGPHSGKSTIAYGVASALKLRGISSELVTEVAKDKVWDEAYTVLRNQVLIGAEQYHRLWRLKDKVDVVITDSPIILSVIYNKQFKHQYFNPFMFELFDEFDNMNIVIERRIKHEYDKTGRIHDELEAIELDKQIRQMLINKGIIYNTLPCEEESIKEVLSLYDHC